MDINMSKQVLEALATNRKLQQGLKQRLIEVQRSLSRNAVQQSKISRIMTDRSLHLTTHGFLGKQEHEQQTESTTLPAPTFEHFYQDKLCDIYPGQNSFGYPSYFCDDERDIPPVKEDSLPTDIVRNTRQWSRLAIYRLKVHVSVQARELLKKEALRCHRDRSASSTERDSSVKNISYRDRLKEIQTLKLCSPDLLKVDPDLISWSPCTDEKYGLHTALACKQKWVHDLSPYFRRESWTKEEDALLLGPKILHENIFSYWKRLIDTKKIKMRTLFNCFQRYKTLLLRLPGRDLCHRTRIERQSIAWSSAEETELTQAIELFGVESDWKHIVAGLSTKRTISESKRHWKLMNSSTFVVNPKQDGGGTSSDQLGRKERWNATEKRRLAIVVEAVNTNSKRKNTDWVLVAELMPDKSPENCRAKYKRMKEDTKKKIPNHRIRKKRASSGEVAAGPSKKLRVKRKKKEILYMDDIDLDFIRYDSNSANV